MAAREKAVIREYQRLSYSLFFAFSVIIAEQWLTTLGYTVEDGSGYQCSVCDNSVGCDTGVAGEIQNQKVKYNGSDS